MTDPFDALGLSPDADEAEIRRRYLDLVRQYPPEHAPEEFARIREAYDRLRDPVERVERLVFSLDTTDSIEDIIAELRSRSSASRIPTKTLLSLAEG